MNNLLNTPTDPNAIAAQELLQAPRRMREVILNELEHNVRKLWTGDTDAILSVIGTDADELFQLNQDFAQLIATFLTQQQDSEGLARLQSIQSLIRPHTVHEDGTVTMNPVVEEEDGQEQ